MLWSRSSAGVYNPPPQRIDAVALRSRREPAPQAPGADCHHHTGSRGNSTERDGRRPALCVQEWSMTESERLTRRHFLTAATAVTGGVGAVAAAVPFVSSFRPSARAQALGAPVEVDVSKLEPGALMKVEWRGRADLCRAPHRGDARRARPRRRVARRPRFRRFHSAWLRAKRPPQRAPPFSRRRGRLHASGGVLRCRGSRSLPRISAPIGAVDSIVPAMVRRSTSPGAYLRAFRRRQTCRYRRTATSTTARYSSARTRGSCRWRARHRS